MFKRAVAFSPEQSFRAAMLTPGEARKLLWRAGSIALQSVEAMTPDVQIHVGKHFTALFDEVTRVEDDMKVFQSAGALPDGEAARLDMGRTHYVVKKELEIPARVQTLEQLDPEDWLFPASSETTHADRMPAWSNETAALAVQSSLETAYQELVNE